MNTNIDLFEHYDELPLKIKEIINVFNTEIDLTENAYDLCKKLENRIQQLKSELRKKGELIK